VPPSIPVVIFKLVSDPLQHGGLAVARSLGRLGAPVYTAYADRNTPASASRYVKGSFLSPGTGSEPGRILDALRDISTRVSDRPVLIALDDVAATFVDRFAADLEPAFRFPTQPNGLPTQLSDKRRLDELCRATGTPVPPARVPRSETEFMTMAGELGFPVVLKSMDPAVLRSRPQAASVAIANDAAEARQLYSQMEVSDQPNLMLQEYIPGGPTSVWMFNGYFDAGSVCRFGVTGQKIRQTPPDTGATSLGICRDNDAVRAAAVHFLESIGYRGIVDMGFRYDARDESYRLLDVNPRIGSSFRLFVDGGGMDVVRALYLDLTQQPIAPTAVREGRRWLVENQDLATTWKLVRGRRLSVSEWLNSLRGVEELAWWSSDDLRPVALMVLATARQGLAALARRLGRRLQSGRRIPSSISRRC
jgi:predicted ATP-grasp superfamily ATP-dependent carboligase